MQDYSGKWLRKPQTLLFEVVGAVAKVTLNRPEKRNALSHQLVYELRDALLEADDRHDINVVLLEGAGKDFCAGYDLTSSYEQTLEDESALERYSYRPPYGSFDNDCWAMERFQAVPDLIMNMHKPVIAKIHGNCLAGGTDIALRCDIVVAAEDAKIGFPATRANGSPPSHMWTYLVGPQWAKRLLITGDVVLGRDAAKLGLVLDAVPAEELDEFAMALASRVALVDPELSASQKRIVNIAMDQMGMAITQRFAREMDARAHLGTGPRRMQFKTDMQKSGLKTALANRDGPFGDGVVKLRTDR
ncbi:crotonase/enoyl-CoA hydratase family protein [Novosphingobium cyanobacteriorum]|uniref:Crotonase/enoyl-CoA hydratase family protein n=1 Tax=Novosphingobium cyanobacteriorum TaxID=3024215 RepID=A0ABT6CQ69_9SPHN|nr:crotonase/enoyl-CoA hydratase family protein [Novosphingobium cyanobacteriorum]MDF8335388.1 crotonase/enoyl-CoA hydratase family protein [Novosphingobium cyanobacteriorum]